MHKNIAGCFKLRKQKQYSPLYSQNSLPAQAIIILAYGTKKGKRLHNLCRYSHTADMKKLIMILLTAAIAASACGAAACSKGQTGGGNNTLSRYTRETEGEGGYDCGCGKDCGCEGNCRGNCNCGDNCDCEKDGGAKDNRKDMRHGHGKRPIPNDERTGHMDGFEFDRNTTGKRPGDDRAKFGIFAPDGRLNGRRPMPVPPPPEGEDNMPAHDAEQRNAESEQSGDKTADKDGKPQNNKDEKNKKGEKRRKFFGGKQNRRPAQNVSLSR